MDKSPQPTAVPPRRGFTLTELLVVIAIIAVLAALVSVGVMKALDTAKQTRIKVEVDNLDAALKSYKEKYGSYPPCDLYLSPSATMPSQPGYNLPLRQHLARAFPRYVITSTAQLIADLQQAGIDSTQFRPDQALVFWLNGFNPDITQPFFNLKNLPKAQRTTPFFDFDQARLVALPATATAFSYAPAGVKNSAPYVYYEAGKYLPPPPVNPYTSPPYWWCNAAYVSSDAGYAMPYVRDTNGNGRMDYMIDEFVNPDSFQLISPGLDGKFGDNGTNNPTITTTLRMYPTGNPYTASSNYMGFVMGYDPLGADDDNITNFCERARLGDAKP